MLPYTMNNRWFGTGFGCVLGCLLFVASLPSSAQNLVPNHSFEEYDTCLVRNTVYDPDMGPLGWFSAGGSSDHFLSCVPYGSFNGVPLNFGTFQYPNEGDSYAGIITYDVAFGLREYFMIQLDAPLVIGATYYASFFANAAFSPIPNPQVWVASNNVGMLFTTDSRQWVTGDPLPVPANYAQVHCPHILSDTTGWTLVSGSFVADSAYSYVMLGNHFDNANTDTLHFEALGTNPRGYTLIDDVCVSMDPLACPFAVTVDELVNEGVSLYPNPAQQWIELGGGLGPGSSLRIDDLLGRCVWQGVSSGRGLRLGVGSWARGTYVLRMEHAGRVEVRKFVLAE